MTWQRMTSEGFYHNNDYDDVIPATEHRQRQSFCDTSHLLLILLQSFLRIVRVSSDIVFVQKNDFRSVEEAVVIELDLSHQLFQCYCGRRGVLIAEDIEYEE